MVDASYGYTKVLEGLGFDAADEKLRAALMKEGFGVLTEIDVKATMKKKLDVDFRPYRIYGACNPPLAYKALSHELLIGLLLPCNVVLFEDDDGHTVVSLVKPAEMFKVVENPALQAVAEDVDARIRRVLESMVA